MVILLCVKLVCYAYTPLREGLKKLVIFPKGEGVFRFGLRFPLFFVYFVTWSESSRNANKFVSPLSDPPPNLRQFPFLIRFSPLSEDKSENLRNIVEGQRPIWSEAFNFFS